MIKIIITLSDREIYWLLLELKTLKIPSEIKSGDEFEAQNPASKIQLFCLILDY